MSDPQTELEALRATTLQWGLVLEPQVKHLAMWIQGAVPEATQIGLNVDVDRFLVEFEAEVPPGTPQHKDLLDGMVRSIHWMLGPGWDVEVRASEWTYRARGDVKCRTISRKRKA